MTEPRSLLAGDKLNFDKVQCLIVDDNHMSLEILGNVCMSFGLRNITKAHSSDEAKAALNRQAYDLIMTDSQLPGLSGFDLIKWMRRDGPESNRLAPVIMITSHVRVSDVARCRDCGAHFILAKPVTPKIMLERLNWVARDDRVFIECSAYCGPDRRIKREGPPPGIEGRRADDLPLEIGEDSGDSMSQSEINALMKPSKVTL